MQYYFTIHKDNDGFWAECNDLKGCVTQADSLAQLEKNCEEALHLYLEEPAESGQVFPLPSRPVDSAQDTLAVRLEPELALAVLLRNNRYQLHLTQQQACKILGMKNIFSYQRLEKKANPTLKVMKKIQVAFPHIRLEQLFS